MSYLLYIQKKNLKRKSKFAFVFTWHLIFANINLLNFFVLLLYYLINLKKKKKKIAIIQKFKRWYFLYCEFIKIKWLNYSK